MRLTLESMQELLAWYADLGSVDYEVREMCKELRYIEGKATDGRTFPILELAKMEPENAFKAKWATLFESPVLWAVLIPVVKQTKKTRCKAFRLLSRCESLVESSACTRAKLMDTRWFLILVSDEVMVSALDRRP